MTAFKKETVHDESAAQPTGSFAHILSSPLLVSIVIAVITLAVFIHVLSADFVMWDDDKAIYNNPNIRDLDLGRIFTDVDSTMRYNPLTLLGWCITYHLFKLNPFWFHFSNWLLHGLNASLVFLVIRRFLVLVLSNRYKAYVNPLRVTIAAGLASLLWSVHPLRVEPVAWCTDLTYCQALFFLLLSLQFYLLANDLGMGMRRHYLLLATSVIFYMISLLSHALGMTFFLILPVIDICLFVKPGSGDDRPRISFPNRRMLLEKIPFAVAALAISLVTIGIRMASAGIWDKPVSLAEFGLFERFMQAMYIWAYYLWRPWYPVNLYPCYPTLVSFNPLSPPFVASAMLVIGLIILVIILRRRQPLGLALVICHLILLVPVLGFWEHPYYPCDRYSLIASILWSVLLAVWLVRIKTKPLICGISLVLPIIVIATLGTLTFRQTHVWTNSRTLFEHTIKALGNNTYRCGIYWRLGWVYRKERNTDEAIEYFSKAVEISPGYFQAHTDLGAVLLQKNRAEEAILHLNRALSINPNYGPANIYLAVALGRFDEAIKLLNDVVRQKPDSIEGNYWLSVALRKTGKTGQAVTYLKETLRLSPNWVNPINDLARTLATDKDPNLRDPNEAIRLAKRGCALTNYEETDMLDTLAAAYASAGKFTDAVQYGEKAFKSAELSNMPEQCEDIKNRISLYRQGQPYIEH